MIVKRGDQEFFFKCLLGRGPSAITNGSALPLSFGALKYLEIVDNIFDPFYEGVVIVSNTSGVIEKENIGFDFVGDGRDFF